MAKKIIKAPEKSPVQVPAIDKKKIISEKKQVPKKPRVESRYWVIAVGLTRKPGCQAENFLFYGTRNAAEKYRIVKSKSLWGMGWKRHAIPEEIKKNQALRGIMKGESIFDAPKPKKDNFKAQFPEASGEQTAVVAAKVQIILDRNQRASDKFYKDHPERIFERKKSGKIPRNKLKTNN